VNGPESPRFSDAGEALVWAARELHQIESGSLVAQVLLSHVWRQPQCWTLAHPDVPFPPGLSEKYAALVRRARGGEPLAYLTGIREFYGVEIAVTPDVLIPRPETELLVSTAIDWLADRPVETVRALDLGTGSGCITVALAVLNPGLAVTATDQSSAALAVAARNFRRHGVAERAYAVQADLLSPFSGPFDLLCANLPYIPSGTLAGLDVRRFEPVLALDGGEDGLRIIERALGQCKPRMAAGGLALFEIESSLGAPAQELARRFFPRESVSAEKDAAGLDRLLVIRT
jgi:release factor glutamine methyltransferase